MYHVHLATSGIQTHNLSLTRYYDGLVAICDLKIHMWERTASDVRVYADNCLFHGHFCNDKEETVLHSYSNEESIKRCKNVLSLMSPTTGNTFHTYLQISTYIERNGEQETSWSYCQQANLNITYIQQHIQSHSNHHGCDVTQVSRKLHIPP